MELELEIEGVKEVQGTLAKLSASLLNWEDEFKIVGDDFTEYFATVPFATQGSVYGKRWAALSPAYEDFKAKNFPGRPILIRTSGFPKDSYTLKTNKDSLTISNISEIFGYHQEGTPKMPARVIMDINQNREQRAYAIFLEGLNKKVEQAT